MTRRHSAHAALRGEPGYIWRSGQERRLGMMREWVNLHGRILDNGCGLGTYLSALSRYSGQRFGLEVEMERAIKALPNATGIAQAIGERLPFADDVFDLVLSNEVIEHVTNDRLYAREMVRVTRPGGQILIFCPNRWYPVEQHGIFWRGEYKFGNVPLVNYLPDQWRNQLAPHVRTYTRNTLLDLFRPLPVRVVHHERLFGGYDNIAYRWPKVGTILRKVLYTAEKTPLSVLGLSHLLVLEKKAGASEASDPLS